MFPILLKYNKTSKIVRKQANNEDFCLLCLLYSKMNTMRTFVYLFTLLPIYNLHTIEKNNTWKFWLYCLFCIKSQRFLSFPTFEFWPLKNKMLKFPILALLALLALSFVNGESGDTLECAADQMVCTGWNGKQFCAASVSWFLIKLPKGHLHRGPTIYIFYSIIFSVCMYIVCSS